MEKSMMYEPDLTKIYELYEIKSVLPSNLKYQLDIMINKIKSTQIDNIYYSEFSDIIYYLIDNDDLYKYTKKLINVMRPDMEIMKQYSDDAIYESSYNTYSVILEYMGDKTYKNYKVKLRYKDDYEIKNIVSDVNKELLDNKKPHNFVNIKFDKIINPYKLLSKGIIPFFYDDNLPYESIILTVQLALSESEQIFWYETSVIKMLMSYKIWSFLTLDFAQKLAKSNANSFFLYFSYPNMLYDNSMRPKTDMSIFRTPLSKTSTKNILFNTDSNIKKNYIPVTRYASGMSRSLYYDNEKNDNFCGTFYYKEPESTTYLEFNTYIKGKNKVIVGNMLSDIMKKQKITHLIPLSHELDHLYSKVLENPINKLWILGKLHPNLKYTPLQYIKTFNPEIYGLDDDITYNDNTNMSKNDIMFHENSFQYVQAVTYPGLPIENINQTPKYVGHELNLYAFEDIYDQPLCRAASALGYDIIILEEMIGSFQIVTEILDTRSKSDSFSSLIFT
jgi:hypothetical protein